MSMAEIGELFDAWSWRERRRDLRFGRLSALIANVHRSSKTHPIPYYPADFFETLQSESHEWPDDGELEGKMDHIASALG
ncbi:MAG: hypothetical protein IPK69_11890 [Phycisphaerales bacterium]|nr:MAG: hypothetical protein IPK69_11890 [Phycisphaerales bacterium]